MTPQAASLRIKEEARNIGFAACGIALVAPAETEAAHFDRWLANGSHAGMRYMENYRDLRLNPAGLIENARSVISVALNYYPTQKQSPDAPRIAYYAYGQDYHTVLKQKLARLLAFIQTLSGSETSETPETPITARCFTDSAPLLERYWAWKAGLGWIGKNTCLILPQKGSYFFLGEIVTNLVLPPDAPQKDRCGTCTRCLQACPTGALTAPRILHAPHCLSYLTIEHKGEIPPAQAAQLGNRLYGCDTCQQACPWNRFATPTPVTEFQPTPRLLALKKETLSTLTRDEYNSIFRHSPVKRAKYEGLLRNSKELE